MRFLADESCDFAVVRALRTAGHEVVAVSEIAPRADDQTVIDLAVREGRILLTEDKDFGRLAHAHGRAGVGVVFVRYPATARASLPQAVVDLVTRRGETLIGQFVIMQPGRIRIARTPGG